MLYPNDWTQSQSVTISQNMTVIPTVRLILVQQKIHSNVIITNATN